MLELAEVQVSIPTPGFTSSVFNPTDNPVATTTYNVDVFDGTNTVSGQVTVIVNNAASIGSVTGTTPLCIGASDTYTANAVVLSGGTGAWSSSNTGIATVNSSGLVTGASIGTCNIIYTITGGCGGTVSAQQPVTIISNASIGSVTGTTPLCLSLLYTSDAADEEDSVDLGG